MSSILKWNSAIDEECMKLFIASLFGIWLMESNGNCGFILEIIINKKN